jgi:hypothetical protein
MPPPDNRRGGHKTITGATSEAGTAYPFGAPKLIPRFSGVRVTRSLVLYVCFVDCYVGCLYPFSRCAYC